MFTVGREGPAEEMEDLQYTEEVFSRLAGQVDINLRKNKIIFLVPTKTRNTVTMGGAMFEVTSTNRWNELDGENGPPMFDMDAHIADMLEGCLASPRNLREQFSNHARPYFSTGFNWLEIDTIVTTILPRFHQRIEGMRTSREAERLNLGAPADVLMAYGLDPMPGASTNM